MGLGVMGRGEGWGGVGVRVGVRVRVLGLDRPARVLVGEVRGYEAAVRRHACDHHVHAPPRRGVSPATQARGAWLGFGFGFGFWFGFGIGLRLGLDRPAALRSASAGMMVRSRKSATRDGEVGSGRPWQSETGGSTAATLMSRHTTCSG